MQKLDLMYTHLSHYHSEHHWALVIFLSRVDLNAKNLSNTLAFTIDLLTSRPSAILTSYKGHWETEAHTANSSTLLLCECFFFSFLFKGCWQSTEKVTKRIPALNEMYLATAVGPSMLLGSAFAFSF